MACIAVGGLAATEFHNHGTRPEVTKSFDCEVRRHAWEFAKATLPERGAFRTAFEALQLEACDLATPADYDEYVSPTFATPASDTVIHADPSAAPGGDGSQAKPFRTFEAAVDAAAVPGPKTILLHAGTYHTSGVVLTAAHSNLTIQNFDGADAVVSGAVPVANSKDAWSLHDARTNTWKLSVRGQQLSPEFGLRIGTRRAIRAKYPNGDPETAAAYCVIPLGSIASPGTR
jgi:hypothetical protein